MSEETPVRSLFVFGGARSGKSGYAQRLAEGCGLAPVLIATAEAHDDEMRARIARHAAARAAFWRLVEEPLALAQALEREASPGAVVLVDCATLWLSNLMLREEDPEAATAGLRAAIARLSGPAIFVSNEVGCGLVPGTALGRAFRDAQGRLNQSLAEACDAAVELRAGLPLQLKPAAAPRLRFAL
ncbi:bifunctional adenosylcobinamide kinase/adenosylcobinamide-phosphate guanylyltransferase [Methylocella sp.]|uniref:bifunctional adenosylcobinamide kinase/adenosylcobinamide-phosphate guanylyltransferase n=1 Tax=Methylocella sp. TaxID=1978226 RepID=UPI003782F7C5